jgi:hypothetical protein
MITDTAPRAGARPSRGQRPGLAAKLRPRELIAMLTHHYMRARAQSLPPVKITLSVRDPFGRQAVTLSRD